VSTSHRRNSNATRRNARSSKRKLPVGNQLKKPNSSPLAMKSRSRMKKPNKSKLLNRNAADLGPVGSSTEQEIFLFAIIWATRRSTQMSLVAILVVPARLKLLKVFNKRFPIWCLNNNSISPTKMTLIMTTKSMCTKCSNNLKRKKKKAYLASLLACSRRKKRKKCRLANKCLWVRNQAKNLISILMTSNKFLVEELQMQARTQAYLL